MGKRTLDVSAQVWVEFFKGPGEYKRAFTVERALPQDARVVGVLTPGRTVFALGGNPHAVHEAIEDTLRIPEDMVRLLTESAAWPDVPAGEAPQIDAPLVTVRWEEVTQ